MGEVVLVGLGVTLGALVIQALAGGLGAEAVGVLLTRRSVGASLWADGSRQWHPRIWLVDCGHRDCRDPPGPLPSPRPGQAERSPNGRLSRDPGFQYFSGMYL